MIMIIYETKNCQTIQTQAHTNKKKRRKEIEKMKKIKKQGNYKNDVQMQCGWKP